MTDTVKIRRTYKFRIYPTAEQAVRLRSWQDSLRFLWNICLEQRLMGMRRERSERVYPNWVEQCRQLTGLRAELEWLADVPRRACDKTIRALDDAWKSCWSRRSGAPRWKSRDGAPCRIAFYSAWIKFSERSVSLPKIGPVRAVCHRTMSGRVENCSAVSDGDQWFICVGTVQDVEEPAPRTGPAIALDVGITNLVATSDGDLIENPRHFMRAQKSLARAQRQLARKQKGSKRREKARARVMRLHRRVRRQREHFLHTLSSRLAKSHGVVVIENLNVAGMVRSTLAKHIADAGWSMLARFLKYKLEWTGGRLELVPAAYSSQTCNECGVVDAASRSGERFKCTGCGHEAHADINAAKNLLARRSRPGLLAEATT